MTMNVVGMFELLLDTSICKVYVVKFVIFLTEFLKFSLLHRDVMALEALLHCLLKQLGKYSFMRSIWRMICGKNRLQLSR